MANDLLSIAGVLRVGEFCLSMIAWALTVSFQDYNKSSNLVYGVTVLITFWLIDIAWIVTFAFGFNNRINFDSEKWGALNFGVSTAGAFLIFVAACCIAAEAGSYTVVQAGAGFAYFTCFNWIASLIFAWREMRGSFFWERS